MDGTTEILVPYRSVRSVYEDAIGRPKARKAVEHSILVAAFHILAGGVPYADLGADWFQKPTPVASLTR